MMFDPDAIDYQLVDRIEKLLKGSDGFFVHLDGDGIHGPIYVQICYSKDRSLFQAPMFEVLLAPDSLRIYPRGYLDENDEHAYSALKELISKRLPEASAQKSSETKEFFEWRQSGLDKILDTIYLTSEFILLTTFCLF